MEKKEIYLYAPNLIAICIDRKSHADYEGKLWNEYSESPQEFHSILEIFRMIEDFLDELDFPQRSTVPRSFAGRALREETQDKRKGKTKKMGNLEDKNGEEGTFIVQIKYRQNATWQGQVVWAEQNKKEYFRSALELLRLIDGAMSGGEKGFEAEGEAISGNLSPDQPGESGEAAGADA